ncbi:hypothetical protein D3C72_1293090 [compost metagenome]
MHADKHYLEAAHEVTQRQQLVVAVAEGLADRLADGLVLAGAVRHLARFAQGQRQRQHHAGHQRHHIERVLPAQAGNQPLLHRDHQELPERARRSGDAHRPHALLGAGHAADHAVDDAVGGAGLGDADHHAGTGGKGGAAGGQRHHHQPGHVQRHADQHDAQRAKLVGERPGKGLAGAPHQVLQRQREGEGLAVPAVGLRDRQVEQAEAVPDAHGKCDEQAAAHQHGGQGELSVLHCLGSVCGSPAG